MLICCAVALLAPPIARSSAGSPPAGPNAPGSATAAPRPNILLLVSDDQAWSTFSRDLMPSTFRDLVDQGILFKRAYVNTSLCCPSRAQILTGLFEHHTGVDANAVPLDRPTIVQALHDTGYRTMLAGKYLNSWETCGPRPEFDRWDCVSTPLPSSYSLLNPWINEDGTWLQRSGYQTDILADDVVQFIKSTPDDQPFFAMYTPTSPHLPADDFRYADMPVTPPHGPAFDQDTLTAKSPLYARRGPLTSNEIHDADGRYAKMSHAVRSLDDGIAHILDNLGDRTRDTIVIYLSDNGFLFGEHRRFGKTDAYEESVRVPMIVRYPALLDPSEASTSQALVSNVDIAPSIARLAGFPWNADGRSFVPLVDGSARSTRSALLIEHCQGVSKGTPPCSGLSFFAHQTRAGAFRGVVTSRYKYVQYDDGSRELFDLQHDPNELVNLVGSPHAARTIAGLRVKLASLEAPAIDTTIVTGPWPARDGPSRSVAFTFFSPSRFSTYRCRLVRGGAADPWHACDGQSDAIGNLPDGDYTFEVDRHRRGRPNGSDTGDSQLHDRVQRTSRLDRCPSGGGAAERRCVLLLLELDGRRDVRVPSFARVRTASRLGTVCGIHGLSGSRGRLLELRGPGSGAGKSNVDVTACRVARPRRSRRPDVPAGSRDPPTSHPHTTAGSSSFPRRASTARSPAAWTVTGGRTAAMARSPSRDCRRARTCFTSRRRMRSATSASRPSPGRSTSGRPRSAS